MYSSLLWTSPSFLPHELSGLGPQIWRTLGFIFTSGGEKGSHEGLIMGMRSMKTDVSEEMEMSKGTASGKQPFSIESD